MPSSGSLETVLCAAIFSAFAGCLFGEIIGDSGWRPVFTFISIWFLGALCATIDLRHRRRRRQVDTSSD